MNIDPGNHVLNWAWIKNLPENGEQILRDSLAANPDAVITPLVKELLDPAKKSEVTLEMGCLVVSLIPPEQRCRKRLLHAIAHADCQAITERVASLPASYRERGISFLLTHLQPAEIQKTLAAALPLVTRKASIEYFQKVFETALRIPLEKREKVFTIINLLSRDRLKHALPTSRLPEGELNQQYNMARIAGGACTKEQKAEIQAIINTLPFNIREEIIALAAGVIVARDSYAQRVELLLIAKVLSMPYSNEDKIAYLFGKNSDLIDRVVIHPLYLQNPQPYFFFLRANLINSMHHSLKLHRANNPNVSVQERTNAVFKEHFQSIGEGYKNFCNAHPVDNIHLLKIAVQTFFSKGLKELFFSKHNHPITLRLKTINAETATHFQLLHILKCCLKDVREEEELDIIDFIETIDSSERVAFCENALKLLPSELLEKGKRLEFLKAFAKVPTEQRDQLVKSIESASNTPNERYKLFSHTSNVPFERRVKTLAFIEKYCKHANSLQKTNYLTCLDHLCDQGLNIFIEQSSRILSETDSVQTTQAIFNTLFGIPVSDLKHYLNVICALVTLEAPALVRVNVLRGAVTFSLEDCKTLPSRIEALRPKLGPDDDIKKAFISLNIFPDDYNDEQLEFMKAIAKADSSGGYAVFARYLGTKEPAFVNQLLNHPNCLKTHPIFFLRYSPEIVEIMNGLTEPDEVLSAEEFRERVILNPAVKEAVIKRLNHLIDTHIDPNFHLRLAQYFSVFYERLNINHQDPIFLRFSGIMSVHQNGGVNHLQSPYRIYHDLETTVPIEPLVSFSPPVEQFKFFQHGVEMSKQVAWDLQALRTLNEWDGYKVKHLQEVLAGSEGVSKEAIGQLFNALESRLEVPESKEQSYNTIKKHYDVPYKKLKASFLSVEMAPWLIPEESLDLNKKVVDEKVKLFAILRFILEGSKKIAFLNECEERLLAFCSHLNNCSAKKDFGISNYYKDYIPDDATNQSNEIAVGAITKLFQALEAKLNTSVYKDQRLDEIEKKYGFSYQTLKAFFSRPEFVSWFNSDNPNPQQTKQIDQLYAILGYILRGDQAVLSEQEERLLAFCASVEHCPTGKGFGISNYYNSVLPMKYKVSNSVVSTSHAKHAEDIYNTFLQGILANIFSGEKLCRDIIGNDSLEQMSHFSGYLKNRFHRQAALRHGRFFDAQTLLLNPKLLQATPEQVLKSVYGSFLPSLVLKELVRKSGELFKAEKEFYGGFKSLVCQFEGIEEKTFEKQRHLYVNMELDEFAMVTKLEMTERGAAALMLSQNSLEMVERGPPQKRVRRE